VFIQKPQSRIHHWSGKKTEEGGTETESSSASEANKNAGKAQVIGDAVYSKVMDGLLNQN
jgi:hypothetical protein